MQKSKDLNQIIASRRAMLMGGGAALAALAMPSMANASVAVSSFTDFDILNFALNLEYLEANFYYMAAFGTTIDKPNTVSNQYNAPSTVSINGSSTTGVTATTTGATAVPFTIPAVKAYAIETAIEEAKHVLYLQTAIKSFGGSYVAQPAIDISPAGAFSAVAKYAGVGAPFVAGGIFNPYLNDVNFLGGAYIFEDVGVSAYAGAAPLISQSTTGKTVLGAAAKILTVESYHAGLIRANIYLADPTNAQGILSGTQAISQARTNLANAGKKTVPAGVIVGFPDDFGLYPGTYPQSGTTAVPTTGTVSLAGAAGVSASNIADANPSTVIGYGRTTDMVLNIVTAGNSSSSSSTKAQGGFFPSGLNGTFV